MKGWGGGSRLLGLVEGMPRVEGGHLSNVCLFRHLQPGQRWPSEACLMLISCSFPTGPHWDGLTELQCYHSVSDALVSHKYCHQGLNWEHKEVNVFLKIWAEDWIEYLFREVLHNGHVYGANEGNVWVQGYDWTKMKGYDSTNLACECPPL